MSDNSKAQEIADNFGANAKTYDEYAHIQRAVAQKLSELLPQNSPNHILEIGCGTGFLTSHLIDKYPEAKIDATDLSVDMVAFCRNKFKDNPNVSCYVRDGQDTKLSESYDLIVSSMAIQWFDDPVETIQKLCLKAPLYYASIGAYNFMEWRECLTDLGLPFGGTIITDWPSLIEQETRVEQFNNARHFLTNLKELGAETAHEDYESLNPKDLKKVMEAFDKTDRQITWHIVYGALDGDLKRRP